MDAWKELENSAEKQASKDFKNNHGNEAGLKNAVDNEMKHLIENKNFKDQPQTVAGAMHAYLNKLDTESHKNHKAGDLYINAKDAGTERSTPKEELENAKNAVKIGTSEGLMQDGHLSNMHAFLKGPSTEASAAHKVEQSTENRDGLIMKHAHDTKKAIENAGNTTNKGNQ